MIAKAKLIKRITEDGLAEIEDHVPLGKTYEVDLSSKQMIKGYNWVEKKPWIREMILADGNWFPTELLEIEE